MAVIEMRRAKKAAQGEQELIEINRNLESLWALAKNLVSHEFSQTSIKQTHNSFVDRLD